MLEGLSAPRNKSVYCKVDVIYLGLEPADRKILETAMDDSISWSANALSSELRLRGLSMADTTITKHRKQTCACYRELG
jgi:hypothetical protein